MERASFDFVQWPVLGIYVPRAITAQAMPSLFEEWERICVTRGRHVAALDMRDFDPLFASGPIRRVAAREVKRGMDAYRASLVGVARMVSHPLTRALLTAFDWMVPLPWPVLNTASSVEASQWLCEKAQFGGLTAADMLDLDAMRERERARRGEALRL